MNTPHRDLREHLRALPELAPPPQLSDRIARAQARRVTRWRAGAAAGTLIVACLCALPVLQHAPAPDAAQQRRALIPARDQDPAADVRAIDRALQTAYERGASEDELAPLWAARTRLLATIPHTNDT